MQRVLALGLGIWALGFGSSILAQSPYVAGAIGADVSRSSHASSSLYPSPSNDAEVLSGALRAGTFVGSNWGVELEFVRSGRTNEEGPQIVPLAQGGTFSGTFTVLPAGAAPNAISIPIPFDYRSEVRRRHESIDAVAWARQSVSGSVDLVYLGGVAFSRDRSDITQSIGPALRAIVPPTTFRSTFIQYDTRPLVGMEARIRFTSRIRLIPGFRLQALSDGWLMRPYVGLGWFF